MGQNQVNIGVRLAASFCLVIALSLAGFFGTVRELRHSLERSRQTLQAINAGISLAKDVSLASRDMSADTLKYVYTHDQSDAEFKWQADEEAQKSFRDLSAALARLPHSQMLTAQVDQAQQQDANTCDRMEEQMLRLARQGRTAQAAQIFNTRYTPARFALEIDMGNLVVAASLLRDADVAMYQAKHSGKARFALFEPGMSSRAMERLEMESELRRALEMNELHVQYQPIVSLRAGQVVELEALVRWNHPRLGLIAPTKFIPVAEETGLITDLGRWVLREACRQGREWQREHPQRALGVSVNLSVKELQQPDLVEQIAAVLQETGFPASSLKLEITETVMMLDAEANIAHLTRLRSLGVRLAVDDFGTGYSSMAYLSRLPIDTLKIDRAFVQRLGRQAEDDAIVRAIVTLAKTLDLSITSEGIETPEQLAALQALGCDRGQGYYYARPLTPAAAHALLAGARLPHTEPEVALVAA